jgi:hypothetical protein
MQQALGESLGWLISGFPGRTRLQKSSQASSESPQTLRTALARRSSRFESHQTILELVQSGVLASALLKIKVCLIRVSDVPKHSLRSCFWSLRSLAFVPDLPYLVAALRSLRSLVAVAALPHAPRFGSSGTQMLRCARMGARRHVLLLSQASDVGSGRR